MEVVLRFVQDGRLWNQFWNQLGARIRYASTHSMQRSQ